MVQILKELVSINSDSAHGNESGVAAYIERFFRELGVPVTRQCCGEDRYNVIAGFSGCDDRSLEKKDPATVMYSGHMDVVPAGELSVWATPPYCPSVRNGRLYGRGACDMKASLACSMFMVEYYIRHKISLNSSLLLVYDADEEVANLGLRKYLKDPHQAKVCIVGEPTNLKICTGHRGVMAFTVKLTGKSAHAGKWRLGINPIYFAAKLIRKAEQLQESLCRNTHPVLGEPSIQVTQIHGGERVNVIPDQVELRIDRRLVWGETKKSCEDQLEQLIKETAEDCRSGSEIKTTTYCPAGFVEEEETAVQYLKKLLSFRGMDPDCYGFEASCEAGLIQEKTGIPAIIFGPGSIDQAHQTDEYVELDSLFRGAELYIDLFRSL